MATNKQDKVLNVPPLRFPGFTDEWENNKVGNLFEISVAGDIDKSSISHNQSEKYPYPIISNSLENEGIYGYTNKYKCEAGTITVTGRGTLGIAKSRDYKYYPIVRLLSLKPCDSIDYRFAQYALNLIHYFFEVTGVPQLTAPQLSSYDIRYPTLSEQQKIARFLSLIDERIATQNKIIEDLKKLKSAIIDKVFCLPSDKQPNKRLYGFNGDWTKVKLSEICERITNKNSNLNCNLVLTMAAQLGLVSQLDFFNKSVASENLSSYYVLKKGDFAYNKSYSGEYVWGAIKKLDFYKEGVLSPLYICFRPNQDMINPDFLAFYFESKKWHRGISDIAGEGARNHGLLNISVIDFFNTIHRIPNLLEQKQIAILLQTYKNKINNEERLLWQYQTQRKYLLATMFT